MAESKLKVKSAKLSTVSPRVKVEVLKVKKMAVVEAKTEAPVKVAAKPAAKRTNALSVPMFTLEGAAGGNLDLPKEVFGMEVNKQLLVQAVRVYTNNQKGHFANTKTRGEVRGSTRKIYRQKGTGHARHGGIRAPIFVGGGIALGPKSRTVILDLPKKMKKAALVAALSQKVVDNSVVGVSGLEKASGKTKQMVNLAKKMGQKKTVLLVIDGKNELAIRAVRNIAGMDFATVDQLNVYEVVKHQSLVLTKDAAQKLQERVSKE